MRDLRLPLGASLVLNIFLLGAICGGLWHWSHARAPGSGMGWRMRAAVALPGPRGTELRRALHDTMRGSQPIVQESRDARLAAAGLFAAPRFDAGAALAQLDRARAADVALRARLEQRVVALAATMPADQRATLADALRRGATRGERRRMAQDFDRREPATQPVQHPTDATP